MKSLIPLSALLVAGCATGVGVVEEHVERVNVPVPVKCIKTTDIPMVVTPLNERYTQEEWDNLSVAQKSAAVGFNSLSRLNRETLLDSLVNPCAAADLDELP